MKSISRPENQGHSERGFGSLSVFIIMLLGFSPFLGGCQKAEKEVPRDVVRPVKMMTLQSQSDALKRKYPATVRASQRVDLAFQISGTLKELPLKEGRRVKKGDLLARLDPRDYVVKLRNAEAQLAKAKAALALAKTEYERVLRIRKEEPGAASQSLVDKRLEGVDRARADIQSLRAQVDAAKIQLGYTYLRAPFSGIISKSSWASAIFKILAASST